jgi:hypothetical protein
LSDRAGTCGECGRPPDSQCARCLGYVAAAEERQSCTEIRGRLQARVAELRRWIEIFASGTCVFQTGAERCDHCRANYALFVDDHLTVSGHDSDTVSDGDPCKPPQ